MSSGGRDARAGDAVGEWPVWARLFAEAEEEERKKQEKGEHRTSKEEPMKEVFETLRQPPAVIYKDRAAGKDD